MWTLRLLRDGLRTEEDLSLLHRRQGLALLFAFLDAALCRPTGGGVPADSLVISIGLEVLTAAAAVRQGPVLLLKQGGMLAWVCGAVGSVLQQLKPPEQGGQRRWQRPGGTGGALPKGAMRALQSILTLTSRTIQGFAGQQQQQDARWLEDSDRSLLPLPGVTDQAQALVPLLLLLLQQGLLPPTAHVRHGSSAPPRHTPAAILALARAMLDLLGSLQGRLLPALGLTLKQAVSLVEAVGAMAAPAPVKEDAARRVLGLIVRDAGATEGGGMLQEAGRESAGPDAAASLVEWLLEGTSSLLHAPSCGEHEHEQVLALSMSAGAGRLALRLLQQLQPTAGTAVGARIVASPRRPWPWSLVSLLSCPAFLPGSLHSSDATAPARNAAKAAWLAVAAHLIAVAGQQEQEQGEGGGEEERAFVRELEAILKTTDGGAGVMVDVVGCAVQALIGRERPGTGREGQLQRLREETCTALALLGIPFAAVRTGGWGGKEKQKRPVVAATGNDGPSTSACSKRKRSRKA